MALYRATYLSLEKYGKILDKLGLQNNVRSVLKATNINIKFGECKLDKLAIDNILSREVAYHLKNLVR